MATTNKIGEGCEEIGPRFVGFPDEVLHRVGVLSFSLLTFHFPHLSANNDGGCLYFRIITIVIDVYTHIIISYN